MGKGEERPSHDLYNKALMEANLLFCKAKSRINVLNIHATTCLACLNVIIF